MWHELFKYMDGEGRFLHVEIAEDAMFDEAIKVLPEAVKGDIEEKVLNIDIFEYATEEEALDKQKTILEEEGRI